MAARQQKIKLLEPDQKKGPQIRFLDPIEEVLRKYDRQTNLIIAVLIVAMITMVIMTGTLIIDSFHFNSATYREYSQKTDTYNTLLEENRKNQKIMIENQELMNQLLEENKR